MKTLSLVILGLCFTAAALNAQDDSAPGRTQNLNVVAPIESVSDAQPLFQPEFTPMTQTGSAMAEAITPDIQALAGNLGNDPTNIFNYVHDQIRYVHYFGSKKGAELTLLERSGNDFDQCALLSALLQAAGCTNVGYQFAVMKIPYDSTNHQDLHHWLALSLLNTNWLNTSNYFSNFLGERGNRVLLQFSGDTNTLAFQRVWVTLTLGGTHYYLDPSFKVSEPLTNLCTLTNAMQFSSNTLMSAAGGTDTGSYVTGLSEASLRGALQNCNSNLLSCLSNNIPNATVPQVIGGQQIVSSSGSPLSTSLLFSLYTNGYPLLTWTSQPTNFMGTFSISFGGTNYTRYTPQLQGQRLSLTFSNNGLAQLWLEDSNVLETTITGTSNRINVVLSATHPYGTWNSSLNIPIDVPSQGFDQSSTNAYQWTNANYAIMYAFEAGPEWLQARQQKLDAYRQQGWPDTSRQVVTETLNVMGLDWMVQTELAEELLAQEWGQLPQNHHRLGRMAQEAGRGYYVDVYLQLDGTFPSTSYNTPDIQANYEVFDVGNYIFSAMEHGIIEELQNSNLVAASTVKMIEIANTNSQAVYMASSANWSSVQSSLTGYSSATSNTLNALISSGYILLLPQNGSNNVAGPGTWAGDGYVELGVTANGRKMGMIISGGYNGGYVSDPDSIPSPPAITATDDNQPTFFNPQSATLPFSGQTGADPVNLADGSFQITASDLTLGQTEPRGLNLTRYYSSARRNSNPAGMAPGWLHNYYCNVLPTSAPQIALGAATAQQMTPMLVATCAALNLYNYLAPDPKNWTVTALIAKWGIDQIINNAVSVNLGKDTLQFLKQPNGLYTPPANCTMSLVQTNGAYWLLERHGRTFKFGTNNLLTTIVDPYGRAMNFTYNSNNLVTNITDWTNRSLTFSYLGGTLTNVADSTGRSVSYGYTGGDLTSFTDAEGKTNGYTYDTNHQAIATLDALGRLVVTNTYDGFGHVTTQLTQGDTNKTWQIFASGYYTVEIDPAGGQRVFTYDNKSRLVASQDALSNVTQMVYDGQDHVVQTISPLGETNQFIYDGNNNLTATIDPLGYSNQFFYDTQNNLYRSVDARGNPSTFGYNAQFSLTGSTNGAGDWITYTYNGDGTLYSRSDPGGTTTYGYDNYGQLSSITYPGSLGNESFGNNALGDVTNHVNARQFATAFQYNLRRQLTSTVAPTNITVKVAYDAVGNQQSVTDARGATNTSFWSPTRHLTGTVFPSTSQGTPAITNLYDSRDWLIQTINNPLSTISSTTSFTNDLAGRLISTTDPLLRTTRFGYDADARKTATTNAALETTRQQWNARGQMTLLTDPATHTVQYAFDGAGNQITLTNRNGNKWQFSFDAASRLTNTTSPLIHKTSQVWNNRGLLQSVTDPNTNQTTLNYDAKSRLTNRTDSVGTTLYQYDANNNLTNVLENGGANSWTFDAYDRASGYRDANGNLLQYRYDANGNLINLVYPGGKTVYYAYDSLNRLTNVTDWASRQTTFTYDLANRVTSITRPNGTVRLINYDAAGETTNIVEKTLGNFPIAFFTLGWTNSGRVAWEFGAPLPQTNAPPTRNMVYDGDNCLTNFNNQTIVHDADGNMTSGPLTNTTLTTYTYDARNRLLSAGGLGYDYDPAGNRESVTSGTNVVQFVINPHARLPQTLIRTKADGSQTLYVYGLGLLYEVNLSPGGSELNTRTYHYDCRGSTVALTDQNGNLTDRIQYSAYGMTTYRVGTNDTPFLYNGRYGVMTDANGLLYMRARYYNPYLCRFVNPDPSGFGGGLNFYCYANGNPISCRDPSGLGAVGDSTTSSWLAGSSATPTDLSNPFGLAIANEQDDWSDKAVDFINAQIDAYQQAQAARPAWAQQLDQFAQLAVLSMAPEAGLLEETAAAEETALSSTLNKVGTLDFSTPANGAVFYSGPGQGARAAAFAQQSGGMTIEMTQGGQQLMADSIFQSLSPGQQYQVWQAASAPFAQGASGGVNAFISGARATGTFRTIEEPILNANPNVFQYSYHY